VSVSVPWNSSYTAACDRQTDRQTVRHSSIAHTLASMGNDCWQRPMSVKMAYNLTNICRMKQNRKTTIAADNEPDGMPAN